MLKSSEKTFGEVFFFLNLNVCVFELLLSSVSVGWSRYCMGLFTHVVDTQSSIVCEWLTALRGLSFRILNSSKVFKHNFIHQGHLRLQWSKIISTFFSIITLL